jgi:hypothetical protein
VAIRACPRLPPTVAERIKCYRAQNVADSVLFREALAVAAEARGWAVHWHDARKLLEAARDALHVADLEAHFVALRKAVGPPWDKDQKVATAAAIVAAQTWRRGL